MNEEGPAADQPRAPSPPLGYWIPLQPPRPKSRSKILVVLAYVAAVLPIPLFAQIAGAVLAIIHLNHRESLRRLAIAAIAVNAVAAGIWVVFIVVNYHPAQRDSSGAVSQGGFISAQDLKVGDCGKAPQETKNIRDVDVVPCAQPHTFEVYAAYTPPAGTYPGYESVKAMTEQKCIDEFEGYVGTDPMKSELSVIYLYPQSEVAWTASRNIQCLLVTDQPLTGSLKGSRK